MKVLIYLFTWSVYAHVSFDESHLDADTDDETEFSDDSDDDLLMMRNNITDMDYTTPFSYDNATQDFENFVSKFGYLKVGDIPVVNRKVVNGRRVSIHEHPYMASIRRLHAHYLAAALLTKNVVITVAHPIYDVPITELSVVVGENYSDRASQITTVVLIVFHQDFDPYTLVADIALVRIYEDFIYRNNVKAILLASPIMDFGSSPMIAFVTGWGRCDTTGTELCMPRSSKFDPDEKVDPMLRSASFTMSPTNNFCDGYKIHDLKIQEGMLCTGPSRDGARHTCLGAPGAPLVVNARLLGLVSWGFGCGYQYDLPLIYTDIQYYSSWVLHNIVLLRKIEKSNLTELFEANKAIVLSQWLSEGRVLPFQPKLRVDNSMEPLEVDKVLFKLIGEVRDIRDYIEGGKYRAEKRIMYSELQRIEDNMKKYDLSLETADKSLLQLIAENSTSSEISHWITMKLESTVSTPQLKTFV